MVDNATVRAEPVPVASRLYELGVGENILRDAVKSGSQHVFDCTANDPPWLAGMLGSGKIIRALRDLLLPQGWKRSNERNYAITIDPTGTYAIAVAAGDDHTGEADKDPSTRSEKGSATKDAVAENQLTFSLIDKDFPRAAEPGSNPKQTWILLYFIDEDADEIRCEISLPARLSDDGHVNSWRERVILRAIEFAEPPPQKTDHMADDEIDVPVERRAV